MICIAVNQDPKQTTKPWKVSEQGFFFPSFLESSNKTNQNQGFSINKYLKLGVYWEK